MDSLSGIKITKQNIIEAFWKLYSEGGISNVSVTKLCKIAGYNRSTFYAYFQDIYDVLDTIEEQIIPPDEFKNHILIPLMNCSNQAIVLKKIIQLFETYSPYLPVLLGEHGDTRFRSKLIQKLTPAIRNQLSQYTHSSQQLDYIIEYQNAAVLFTISRWYQNKKDIPEEELIDLLLNLTTHGIRNILISNN